MHPATNRYNTYHGGVLATLASFSNGYCKTLSGNKEFSLFETCISYISIESINVELEVKVKVLRFGKSIAACILLKLKTLSL